MARRESPDRIGRYQLLLPIARGGMGVVYLARTSGLEGFERACAVKIVDRSLEPELARDLVEEAKLAARIHHRNVVGVLDVGIESDTAYLAMEYIEGPSLASLQKAVQQAEGVLPLGVGMRILLDLLEGLHAAHELRDATGGPFHVVHRDVSPANVLVGVDGVAKLTDFGIARALSRSSNTSTGVVKGKFSYMGPEQARGYPLDRRADIWAAGVVAWELVTGSRLFPLGNDPATLLAIIGDEPPRASSVVRDLPPALDDAIAATLVRDVKLRCSSAEAFARAVEVACSSSGIELATPAEVAVTVRRFCRAELDDRRAKADAAKAANPSFGPDESQSAPALLDKPPPIQTIALPKLALEPTALDRPPPMGSQETVLMPLVHDPSTFDIASGVIDRDLLLPQRSKWARVALGVSLVGIAVALVRLFGSGASASVTPERGDDASVANRAPMPAEPRGVDSVAPAPAPAPGAVSLGMPSTSASGTVSAFKRVLPRSQKTRGPKLVEDDPYQRKP